MTQNSTRVVNVKAEAYDVYIGRPSKWGNPFRASEHGGKTNAINLYREYILNNTELLAQLHELKGKRLGCYCKPGSCHGDVLVDLIEQGPLFNA